MSFDLDHVERLLARTPAVLRALLAGLPAEWIHGTEGGDTWSPFDVVGHLIQGERTDWIPRARRILEHGEALPFEPFDRFAQRAASRGKSLDSLLDELAALRAGNVAALRALALGPTELALRGRHPELGPVTLRELLATWVAHDLAHLAQVARVLAKIQADEVGPWRAYIGVLDR
jgi:hypothetical protein